MVSFGTAEDGEVLGTELSLKPPRVSKGIHGVLDREYDVSLDLSLGCGSRSVTGLDASVSAGCINLMGADSENRFRLGNDMNPYAEIISPALLMKRQEHDFNFALSLSTGPPKSMIMDSISTCSPQLQRNIDMGATSCKLMVLHVDEGSTSGKWNVPHLGPPLSITHTPCHVGQSLCRDIELPFEYVSTLPAKESTEIDVVSGAVETVKKQLKAKSRICQEVGCEKGARGASGRCISHGGGRRCERPGCLKGAEGKTVFCKAHGGGRRCEHLGCTKTAEGRTDFCIGHGGGRRCTHDGCTHASRGKSGLCIRHGGGKRCQKENCTKSAEGSSGFCISHGGGRRCQKPNCNKGAQGSTTFCKGHGGGRRCTALGCTKGAEGSTQFCKGHGGGKRCSFGGGGVCPKSVHGGTLFCVRHGGGKRCATPCCTKSARGRTSHCVRHGGGKRCQYDGCTKSAQGRTDFCKAHGGGRRCSWLPSSSVTNGQECSPCDKFARDESGLCAFHGTLSKDKRVHGGDLLGLNLPNSETSPFKKMKEGDTSFINQTHAKIPVDHFMYRLSDFSAQTTVTHFIPPCASRRSVPEGRVHGGNIMKFISENMASSSNNY